ncbi:hypothetical protein [Pseudoalteromonas rubra]|uniref:hypothetical protein n=1 Tax=Pseudoalteromonas rubra TaxID=43658 RepID=UPI000F7ACF78|nr:hypothetical protein [Pseudoalteromonas rubra]
MKVFNEMLNVLDSFKPLVSSDVNAQALANMYSVKISENEYQLCTANTLSCFLDEVCISVKKAWQEDCVFYAWFDAMASQIRFSSISCDNGAILPFKRKLKLSGDSQELAHEIMREYSDLYFGTDLCSDSYSSPLIIFLN